MTSREVTENYTLQGTDTSLAIQQKKDITVFLQSPSKIGRSGQVKIRKGGPAQKIHLYCVDTYLDRSGKKEDVLTFGLTGHSESVILEAVTDHWKVVAERDD